MLSSTGPSAKWQGDSLGVFEYLQQHNQSPAYRQRHSVAGTQPCPCFLYREDGDWVVGPVLGGEDCELLNSTRSDSVPTNNWLYVDYDEEWQSDPEITVTTSHPSVCGLISISLHGAAATAQPETGGEYRATGDWSAGRPVFSNGLRYLSVGPGWSQWYVTDTLDSSVRARLESACVTWCPASPRAAVSHSRRFHGNMKKQSSWKYWNNIYDKGDIRVTCDTHDHQS